MATNCNEHDHILLFTQLFRHDDVRLKVYFLTLRVQAAVHPEVANAFIPILRRLVRINPAINDCFDLLAAWAQSKHIIGLLYLLGREQNRPKWSNSSWGSSSSCMKVHHSYKRLLRAEMTLMHTHTHTRFAFGYLWVSLGHIPLAECESVRAKSSVLTLYFIHILYSTPGRHAAGNAPVSCGNLSAALSSPLVFASKFGANELAQWILSMCVLRGHPLTYIEKLLFKCQCAAAAANSGPLQRERSQENALAQERIIFSALPH